MAILFDTKIGTTPSPIEYGEELPVIAPTDGMVNTGWINYFGVPVTSSAYPGYSPTYKAVWEEAPATVDYTLTYETAQGTAPANKTVTVNYGESYTLTAADLPTLEAEGYNFNGWTMNGQIVNGVVISGDILSVGDTISADVTLIAVWRKLATITYHSEHGEVPAPATVELDAFGDGPVGNNLLPTLTEDGYTFKGWAYANGNILTGGFLISGDVDLYAVWEKNTEDYIITYQTAHSTAPNNKIVTVNIGESYTLTETDLPVLTAEGYLFGGWSVDGVIISAGYEISANITLTAVWVDDVPVSQIDPQSMLIGWLVGKKIAAMRG